MQECTWPLSLLKAKLGKIMTEKHDKKQKHPGKGSEDYRGQKPEDKGGYSEKGGYSDTQKKGGQDPKKKW